MRKAAALCGKSERDNDDNDEYFPSTKSCNKNDESGSSLYTYYLE